MTIPAVIPSGAPIPTPEEVLIRSVLDLRALVFKDGDYDTPAHDSPLLNRQDEVKTFFEFLETAEPDDPGIGQLFTEDFLPFYCSNLVPLAMHLQRFDALYALIRYAAHAMPECASYFLSTAFCTIELNPFSEHADGIPAERHLELARNFLVLKEELCAEGPLSNQHSCSNLEAVASESLMVSRIKAARAS